MVGKNKRGKNERKARVVGNKGQNEKERKKERKTKEGRKIEREEKKKRQQTHRRYVWLCGLRISVYT